MSFDFGIGAISGWMQGSPLGGIVNTGNMNAANRNAKRTADTAYNYDAYMANTAHQREVQDLTAAGLNPTLSAGGNGSGGGNAPSQEQFAMPQVAGPNMLGAYQVAKGMEQRDKEIAIQAANSAAGISKTLTGNQLTAAKTAVEKTGLIGKSMGAVAGDHMLNIVDKTTKGVGAAASSASDWLKKAANNDWQRLKDSAQGFKNYWNSNSPLNSPSSGGQLPVEANEQ